MNKLKILFGTLLVMASLLFVAYPIDMLSHPVCMATLQIAPLQAAPGQTVTLDASSSFCFISGSSMRAPITSYYFNFGDGNAILGPNPVVTHTYASAGSYSPAVTVNSQGWQNTATSRISVVSAIPTLPPSPLAIGWFRGAPSSGIAPLSVTFWGSAAGTSPLTYVLYYDITNRSKNATGTIGLTDSALGTYTYPSGGTFGRTYTAELAVSDYHATAYKSAAVQVSPSWITHKAPIVSFTYVPADIFVNDQVNFTDLSYDSDGSVTAWLWSFGDNTTSRAQNATHAYSTAGTYTVSLTAYDCTNLQNSTTKTLEVKVRPQQNQLPVACMTASDTGGYLPFTIVFNGSCSYDPDSAIVYHIWRVEKENGPAIVEVQGNGSPTTWNYTFTETGKYFVYLKVADEQYDAVETNVTVRAEQNPLGPIIGWLRGEPASGYAPLAVSFKSSAIGMYPLTYTLFFSIDDRTKYVTGVINSTDSVLGNFLYISGGTFGKDYTAELVVSDPLNHTISKRAGVHVAPAWLNPNNSQNTCPMVNFTYSPSDVYAGDEVQFTDQSTDSNGQIIYWIWQFGDGSGSGDNLVSGEQNPKHAYPSTGNYTASLIVYDNSGCMNLTRQVIEAKEKVTPPQPQPSGGGSGLYLGPPTPVIIQTSGTGYLDFHPSYALNGTRTYSFNNKTNTTTLTLRIMNLARFARNFTLKEVIPKDVAASLQEVQIIPVPMTIFNQDPEVGWNFTLASNQAFEVKYIFNRYIPFSKFESLPRPVITEITKSEAIPVSPERQVTVAGGFTGFVISSLSNPWIGLIVLAAILVFFFAFTETGKEALDSTATRTRALITSIMDDLEEPKEQEDRTERVKKLKKLMKKKRK